MRLIGFCVVIVMMVVFSVGWMIVCVIIGVLLVIVWMFGEWLWWSVGVVFVVVGVVV